MPAASASNMTTTPHHITSLLHQVHHIVIPPIPCSFPWKNHPDYQQLMEMSETWVLARFANMPGVVSRPTSFAAAHLIQSAFHMLATLTFPTGLSKRMPPIIKMMNWFFMIDNVLDDPIEMGADPDAANMVVDSVLTVFRDTYASPSSSSDTSQQLVCILSDTAAEWWAEMCEEMPRKQKARLSRAFQDYLEANRQQVQYRNSHHLPDLETYFKVRAASIGWWPCAVLIEHSQGFELDDEALSHPLLLAMQKNVVEQNFLVNDITSFKKEYMQGDFFNIISILYFQKLHDPTNGPPTLKQALFETVQMIEDRDCECVRLIVEINNCHDLIKKPGMSKYLEGLCLFISGNIYWHLVSGRYGMCAITDLYATPPNFLVEHHLTIEANK